MKRTILTLLVILSTVAVSAQDFDTYFIDKTLRIDYLHSGNINTEKIEVKAFYSGGKWDGTHSQMIEPHRYGDVMIEVYAAGSDKVIFSRSYSCLFNEYRTTERGETETGSFEESVRIPFPKKDVWFKLITFDRKHNSNVLYKGEFSPTQTPTTAFTQEYKSMDLHIGNTPDKALDILFIPDGYSKKDAKKMKDDMKRFAGYIMNCTPYKEHSQEVNIRYIKGFSEESGISDPNQAVRRNTLLNSSFNTIDLDRYLMCLNVWKMNAIADDAPYDVIIIVANTSKYGGGGIYNFYCTVNNEGKYSDYVIVHELGHLVAGLADEYYNSEVTVNDFYPTDTEPVEPNLTTLVDFESKWKSMMKKDTPIPTIAVESNETVLGVYEGGGYVAEGVFRPFIKCTMKDKLYNAFCPVCAKTLTEAIEYYAK